MLLIVGLAYVPSTRLIVGLAYVPSTRLSPLVGESNMRRRHLKFSTFYSLIHFY